MMLSSMLRVSGVVAALLLLTVEDVSAKKAVSAKKVDKARKAFMKAMEPAPRRLGGDSSRKGRMFQKVLSKAKPVKRKLEEEEDQWGAFGFDATQYSIKYTGCSSVATYSDEMAEEEDVDTVLENKRFVIFRLCPTQYCNKYSVTGCSYDYGEYLVLMEDYLEAFGEYTRERKEQFCEYCRPCIEADEAAAEEAQGDDAARRLNDNAEEEEQCDEDICQDYSFCVDEEPADDDQAVEQVDIDEFFDCMAVEYGDDQELFLGPHCDSDGYSVSIGVFSDENCNNYIGDSMSLDDVAGVAGFAIDTDELADYFPKECLSCLVVEEDWQKEDNGEDENAADDDAAAAEEEEEEEIEILEVCERLYEQSAKCNINFEVVDEDSYQSDEQQDNEQLVCDYIEAIQSGSYTESGEITIDADAWYFNMTNWKNGQEYYKQYQHVREVVLPWQLFALCASIIGCIIMWVWACCLHGALRRKNIPWRPRRGKDTDPAEISRQNSGIVMGRSRSGPNSTPLI